MKKNKHIHFIFVVGLGIVLLLLDAPSTCACMHRMGNWKTGEVRLVESSEKNKLWEALLFSLIYGDHKKIHLDP